MGLLAKRSLGCGSKKIKLARHRPWTEGACPVGGSKPVDGVGYPGFAVFTGFDLATA